MHTVIPTRRPHTRTREHISAFPGCAHTPQPSHLQGQATAPEPAGFTQVEMASEDTLGQNRGGKHTSAAQPQLGGCRHPREPRRNQDAWHLGTSSPRSEFTRTLQGHMALFTHRTLQGHVAPFTRRILQGHVAPFTRRTLQGLVAPFTHRTLQGYMAPFTQCFLQTQTWGQDTHRPRGADTP